MQIQNTTYTNKFQSIKAKRNTAGNNISFRGLKHPETKSMFVFDLDGTLATATTE